ncbi:MAG TPA: Rrf2 family transcriptional regulator [Hyphomicrobiales bacterium]|nr:Rrf2 family transcriptional regulator [Hyphomicrobiales bacterium]
MRNDSRLSRMLHVLLHLGRHDQPLTSEQIAKMLDTNAVVVRRTMAGLREAGYVRSEKGHGGGWTIACDLADITLLDVHEAVGGARIFAIGHENENPDCAVARVVNASLDGVLQQAETLVRETLDGIALADLVGEFDQLCRARGGNHGNPSPKQRRGRGQPRKS